MATQRHEIGLGSLLPSDDNAAFLPYSNINSGTVRDQFIVNFNAAAKGTLDGSFLVPKDWVAGTTKIAIGWTSQTAANNVVWDFDHRAVAAASTLLDTNTTPATRSDTVTTASKPGAADQLEEDLITITDTDWAVDELIQFAFSRDAANASDNKADVAQLFSLVLEYVDA